MKKILPITMTLLLVFFASTALAERGHDRNDRDGYSSRGERVERHLDKKGDRIERRFDRKADYAASQGKYRKAYKFSKKGDRINRRLDHKGERMNAKFDQRRYDYRNHRQDQRRNHHQDQRRNYQRNVGYVQVVSPLQVLHDINSSLFNLTIRQPGLVLGMNLH